MPCHCGRRWGVIPLCLYSVSLVWCGVGRGRRRRGWVLTGCMWSYLLPPPAPPVLHIIPRSMHALLLSHMACQAFQLHYTLSSLHAYCPLPPPPAHTFLPTTGRQADDEQQCPCPFPLLSPSLLPLCLLTLPYHQAQSSFISPSIHPL